MSWHTLVLVAALSVLACVSPPRARSAGPDRTVVLVIVDGLDARDVKVETTPTMARLWREAAWCPSARGRAAMPARTNVNHATLVTGVYPEVHGITGNAFWDRRSSRPRKLGGAEDLLTETLFTVARRSRPTLRTVAAVGKGKLALMFAGAARQSPPSEVWSPAQAPTEERDPTTGYSFDRATLRGAQSLIDRGGPAFVLINLADVDRVSHAAGPRSPEADRARRATDAAIGEFLAFVRARDDWPRTVVIITADHGFDTTVHPPVSFDAAARAADLAGLVSVGDGGVGHVYAATAHGAQKRALLAAARRLALATPGIAEALYLEPNDADGGAAHTIALVHPDWHLGHERGGDLLLVAESGFTLVDGSSDEVRLLGNHGAPAELQVPIIVPSGGAPATDDLCADLTAADVGRSILRCLGLRDVRLLDGRPVANRGQGRDLSGLCP